MRMWSRNLPFPTLQWISLLASLFYATVAVAMGVINKAVIIDFQYPNTFLTLQVSRHVMGALQDQERGPGAWMQIIPFLLKPVCLLELHLVLPRS